jgi:hypothetical protein
MQLLLEHYQMDTHSPDRWFALACALASDHVGGLIVLYLESTKFQRLSKRTQTDYLKYRNRLQEVTFNGGRKLFDLPPAGPAA